MNLEWCCERCGWSSNVIGERHICWAREAVSVSGHGTNLSPEQEALSLRSRLDDTLEDMAHLAENLADTVYILQSERDRYKARAELWHEAARRATQRYNERLDVRTLVRDCYVAQRWWRAAKRALHERKKLYRELDQHCHEVVGRMDERFGQVQQLESLLRAADARLGIVDRHNQWAMGHEHEEAMTELRRKWARGQEQSK